MAQTFPRLYSDQERTFWICTVTRKSFQLIKTCEVLSVTRILRAALAKFCVYVCMYVCVCVSNYFSQTTQPISIKIIPANRASYADCYRLLRFEIFTPTIFKTPKNPQKGAWIGTFKLNLHNIETHISRPRFERFLRNLAHWCTCTALVLILL